MILNYQDIRALVIECLRKPRGFHESPWTIEILWGEVAEITEKRRLKYSDTLDAWHRNRNSSVTIHPNLKGPISDVVWDLIVEGVLRPGAGLDRDHTLPALHLTEHGTAVVAAQVTAYDPEGYIRHLREKVPNADDVIIRYVTESASTLRQNCLLSSTVMLGGASEQAFLLVMEAFRDALNPTDQANFDRAIEKRWTVKLRHEEFMKWYERVLKQRVKGDFGTDGITSLEMALTFVFTYFRTNRNDAGHPSEAAFSREISAANLVMFPGYLKSIYDLIDWIKSHKPL